MKLIFEKIENVQSDKLEVDLGKGFESYKIEDLLEKGLELSDDTDFSTIKILSNNKVLENIEVQKNLKIKQVPIKFSESTVFPDCFFMGGYVIPEGVTEIGKYAFGYYENLTSITIPSSVTKISDYAFYYCENLKTINFTGSEEEWNSITKGTNWNYRVPSDCQIVFNYVNN